MLGADLGGLTLSKLRFYSVGLVAQNKLLTSNEIEVMPIEDVPFADGEITSQLEKTNATAADANGAVYTATAASAVSLKATWLNMSAANRISSPDVRRGELVIIYQFGDSAKYFWTTLKVDANLRKLETVIYAFSATRDENAASNADTTYFLEISTHRKHVRFHTCKADGEPYAYDIQLDTLNGNLTITDDIGNYIYLDSKEHRIELKNTDGSHYDMDKDNLTVTIPTTTKFITKDLIIEASNAMRVSATNTFAVSTTNSTIDASSSASMSGADTTITGNGNVNIQGNSIQATGTSVDIGGSGSVSIHSPATSII